MDIFFYFENQLGRTQGKKMKYLNLVKIFIYYIIDLYISLYILIKISSRLGGDESKLKVHGTDSYPVNECTYDHSNHRANEQV